MRAVVLAGDRAGGGPGSASTATYLFLTDGANSSRLGDFERCFDLFDGNDGAAVAAARERWTALKAQGHTLTYWQQTDAGSR